MIEEPPKRWTKIEKRREEKRKTRIKRERILGRLRKIWPIPEIPDN